MSPRFRLAMWRVRPAPVWAARQQQLIKIRQQCFKLGSSRSYYILQTHVNPTTTEPTLPALPAASTTTTSSLQSKQFPSCTAILLVTPHYAHLLAPSSSFFSKFTDSFESKPVQVVAAVVDGLPGHADTIPRRKGWSMMVTDETVKIQQEERKLPQRDSDKFPAWLNGQTGGTAFDAGPEDQANRMDDQGGSLTFTFPLAPSLFEMIKLGSKQSDVKIGLANTLFQTGMWSTIRYMSTEQSDIPATPDSLTISLPEGLSNPSFQPEISLPLEPLTTPRLVYSGNGNILTQLMNSNNTEPFPASRELEKAVSTWFDNRLPKTSSEQQKAGVAIFARITSSHSHIEYPVGSGILVQQERIRRVLSGGGGWGKKSGLLALDPQGSEGFEIPGRSREETESGERGLVRKGDSIQFYMAVPSGSLSKQGWRFGGVEKIEDESAMAAAGDASSSEEIVQDGIFGAVAEGGFWVDKHKLDVPGGEIIMVDNSKKDQSS